jgi:hypothetical protein
MRLSAGISVKERLMVEWIKALFHTFLRWRHLLIRWHLLQRTISVLRRMVSLGLVFLVFQLSGTIEGTRFSLLR